MAYRLSKITTRTGDDGTTGLGDGTRVSKSALRIRAMGEIDELNSSLGVLRAEPLPANIATIISRIQNQLFDLGGEICIPGHQIVSESHVLTLDQAITEYNASLPPLTEFILPAGSRSAALAHVARTIARRAERSLVELGELEVVSAAAYQYLNRLSDLLFILARTLNREAGQCDVCWTREPAPSTDSTAISSTMTPAKAA